MTRAEKSMVAIDGTDALAYVIIRPGADARGVVIEAAASGISKQQAAFALRHTAQSWDADDMIGKDVGRQLQAAHVEVERLKAELAKYVGKEPTVAEEMAYVSAENRRLTDGVEQAAKDWLEEMETSGLIPDRLPRDMVTDRIRKILAATSPA